MPAVITDNSSPEQDAQAVAVEDRTMAVAVETRPMLEVALAKQRLLELRLVTSEEWDRAAAAVGTQDQLVPILTELQRMKASWDCGCDEQFPVLTGFQAQKILAGKPEELWLDHYLLLEKLGSGGMGDVYKARNTRLPRLEAIKTIHTVAGGENGNAEISLGVERFQREAQLLAQLQHPHLTTIFHAGHDRDVQFIAIEYVRGRNLKEFMEDRRQRGEQISVGTAVDYVITVAEVIAHAHEQGVVHRDVKPANVMITEEGGLKVLDLGIAQLRGPKKSDTRSREQLTQGAVSLGTPEVMAPEQWADAQSVTPASDIYSLGCTLFYLLTGQMPFGGESREELLCAVVSAPRPSASDLRSDIPAELSVVIRKMLAHYPQDRYQTCAQVIEELQPFADRIAERPATDSGRLKRKIHAWALAAGALGALAAIAVVGWRNSTVGPRIDRNTIEEFKRVDAEMGRPFAKVAPPAPLRTADQKAMVLESYANENYLNLAEWLLRLQLSPELRNDNLLEVQTLLNGTTASEIPVDQMATIRVQAARSGYLTMLVFADDGSQLLFQWTKPVVAGKWLTVAEPSASTAGNDEFVIFLTETDPLASGPQRPLIADPPLLDLDSSYAQGLIGTEYSVHQLRNLETAFPASAVFKNVIDHLKSGRPYPFDAQPSPPATWWARQSATLHVVEGLSAK